MAKNPPPVQTPGENQAPANEPEQQAAAEAAQAEQPAPAPKAKKAAQAEQTGGPRTEAEILATMKHGDPPCRDDKGRWIVPPEYGTFTRPDGTSVTRLADGRVIEG
jgi:hypothetical protein